MIRGERWAEGLARAGLLGLTLPACLGLSSVGAASPAGTAERVEVTVSRQGFRPDRVTVRKGEPVRLSLTSSDGEHCFAVDAFRIEKRVVVGRPSVVDLTPDRAGTFVFYDCLADPGGETKPGKLVVAE
jgi:cytochrome c oxidase subunit II